MTMNTDYDHSSNNNNTNNNTNNIDNSNTNENNNNSMDNGTTTKSSSIPLHFGITYSLKLDDKGYCYIFNLYISIHILTLYISIRFPVLIPVQSSSEHDLNATNHYTFTTPYRNDTNINKNDTNSNTYNTTTKTSSDYKKYRLSTISSLYKLPHASPTLFKSKMKMSNNTNQTKSSNSALKIPLSSEYWRSRLKRREMISVMHLD